MASYPTVESNRTAPSTTIIQANGVNAAGSIVSNGQIVTRARTHATISRINAEDAKNPERLVRVISQLQEDLSSSTQAQRSNPFSSPCIVRGLSMYPGQVLPIPHTLQRNYTDSHPTTISSPDTNVTLGLLPFISVVAPTAQYPANQFLILTNAGTATVTFNIVIVGD